MAEHVRGVVDGKQMEHLDYSCAGEMFAFLVTMVETLEPHEIEDALAAARDIAQADMLHTAGGPH